MSAITQKKSKLTKTAGSMSPYKKHMEDIGIIGTLVISAVQLILITVDHFYKRRKDKGDIQE